MRSKFLWAAILLAVPPCPAARLTAPAERAFESYVAGVESGRERHHPTRETAGLAVEPVNGGSWEVSGGLVHHWRGAGFVPNATPRDMLALLRDYDHLARYYAPEVISSRLVAGRGGDARLAMRFRKQRVVTVVLDAEFETESRLAGPNRGYSVSRSMHIWQVDDAGTAREHRRPEGNDDGYLWRLNSYWSFEERGGGLWIECEAVSLTRGVPAGLGWLITPIIDSLPKASLEFTLTATKNALAANTGRRQSDDRTN